MGLFFKGRVIQAETVLKHLLGKEELPKSRWDYKLSPNYDATCIDDHVWLWTNLKTGTVIITGDEGNSWCVELAIGDTKSDAMIKYLKKVNKCRTEIL